MAWVAAIAGAAQQQESGGGGISGTVGSAFTLAWDELVQRPMMKKIRDEEVKEYRRAGRQLGAKQVVGYAKSGVRTDVGTPVRVMAETASRSELAALRAKFAYDIGMYQTRVKDLLSLSFNWNPLLIPMASGLGKSLLMRNQTGKGGGFSSSEILNQQYPKGTTSLYGEHGAAVNTIPGPYTVNFGSYA